jgi:hypothetical protein
MLGYLRSDKVRREDGIIVPAQYRVPHISVLHTAFRADISPHHVFAAANAFYPWAGVPRRIDSDKFSERGFNVHVRCKIGLSKVLIIVV